MPCNAYILKKRNPKRILIVISIFVIAVIAAVITHFAVNVNPIIETVISEEAKHSTTIIINESVKSVVGTNIDYDDIVEISRDGENNIKALSVNTILVNSIAIDTTLVAQSRLKNVGEIPVKVPIGTLSGITFFGGAGPNVNIRCLPIGSVGISYRSDFKSAGINNTLHIITMIVDVSVNVIVPGLSRTVSLRTEVPLVNTVIVGAVPDTYLQSNLLDEMLNLIP
ncbi:MAG: sporulation protein YunB [Clostridia bacterium]|nr:sporulation protein YunB [Clostridia bacterium]